MSAQGTGRAEGRPGPLAPVPSSRPVDSREMVRKRRFQLRPPGLKPTTKVGTLGPYRGRLGFAWIIAPLIAGVAIIVAGYLAFVR